WADRIKLHMDVTIPHVLKTLQIDYENPVPARAQLALVRTLEGVSRSLMIKRDPKLEAMMDKISAKIGELYKSGENKFCPVCAESPAFYYLATGKKTAWLTAAEELAKITAKQYFDEKGKSIKEPPGHAGVGQSLISLYQATGDKYYSDLAQKYMDARGTPATGQRLWPKFAAQHLPVDKMNAPGGHAGSFGWFASALVDVGALTGDKKYGAAAQRIWRNMVDTRMCITGGTGAVGRWEGFGEPYAIHRGGYNETCAASGQVFYNYRLFMLTGEAKYLDVMEVVLLNGFLASTSLEGNRFFYCNPLESGGGAGRLADRRVPCCHGSVSRTIPQVPGYMYAHTDSDVYVSFYACNATTVNLASGRVGLKQETNYPFDRNVSLTVSPASDGQKFAIKLRIPTWLGKKFMPGALYSYLAAPQEKWSVKVNGQLFQARVDKGFAVIDRKWKSGDKVQLDLPMPVRISTCIDKVDAYRGRVAVTRGPLVYCAEEVDNGGPVHQLGLGKTPTPAQRKVAPIKEGILKGVPMISFPGVRRVDDKQQPTTARFVPYYCWGNRGAKSMSVWLPRGKIGPPELLKWVPSTGAGEGKKLPRSRGGDATTVIFENKSKQRVKIVWIGYRGRLKEYAQLDPGKKHSQSTRASAAWLITDEKDNPLGHFIATSKISQAIIPPKAKNQ
ncbi:MAG: hypothetical protein HN350_15405, partial [Phycisphaerales bacterium]|nr:hypothetical protein [Phycisphaerales bacterium]